jgi:hypothetical protein
MNKVSLEFRFPPDSCSDTESIRDDSYWTSRENNLDLIELSSQFDNK